jgi:site-specific DNA recombinase
VTPPATSDPVQVAKLAAEGLPSTGPDLTIPKGCRAAVYCRISKTDAGDDSSLDRQETDCRAYAAAEGLSIVTVERDHNRSAFKRGVIRRGWEAIISGAEAREFDVLIAWHSDRLSRNDELERLIDLVERTGLSVVTVTGGDYDLRTPAGRLVARILNALARNESEHKSDRVTVAVDQMKAEGRRANGGKRQFGFERDGVRVNGPERDALVWAAERIVAGHSLRSTARAMPLGPPYAKAWNETTMRQALVRPSVAGLVECHERGQRADGTVGRMGSVELVEGQFPALLSRELWERMVAILADPARKQTRPSRSYLLSGGIARDQHGRNMNGRPGRPGRKVYWSGPRDGLSGCTINAAELEGLVSETLLDRADGMRLVMQRGAEPDGATDLVARRAELEAETAELHARLRAGRITRALFLAMAEALAADESALEADERAELAAAGGRKVSATLAAPGALRGAWEALDHERRAAIVRAEVAHVLVLPGDRAARGFDPDRVVIRWADGEETTWSNGARADITTMADHSAAAKVAKILASHVAR